MANRPVFVADDILYVKAVNTEDDPDNVAPKQGPGGTVDSGRATIKIPALSWNVIRFSLL